MSRVSAGYCEAVSRRQAEASSWGESQRGCGNLGVTTIDGHWCCRVHADPSKRYGWNTPSRRTSATPEQPAQATPTQESTL